MTSISFIYDNRLGISVPHLGVSWNDLSPKIQAVIVERWERIRGHIPDRIYEVEEEINRLQQALYEEEDFEQSCIINSQISELASIINELWIWYRTVEDVNNKVHA